MIIKNTLKFLGRQSLFLGVASVLSLAACSDDTTPVSSTGDDDDDSDSTGNDDDESNGGTGDEDDNATGVTGGDDDDGSGTGGGAGAGGPDDDDDGDGGGGGGETVDLDRRCENEFIKLGDVLDSVERDVQDTTENSREFIRYFSLTEMSNAGFCDDAIELAEFALAKAVYSTSNDVTSVEPLKAVEDQPTVLKIDLRDLGWDKDVDDKADFINVPLNGVDNFDQFNVDDTKLRVAGTVDTWERLTRDGFQQFNDDAEPAAAADGIDDGETRLADVLFFPDVGEEAEDIFEDTLSPFFMVNGLAFIYHATRAPLYNDLLELPTGVGTTDGAADGADGGGLLEGRLEVDIADDVNDEDVIRAGISGRNSNIALQNRLVQRHESDEGFAWVAFDFEDDFCNTVGVDFEREDQDDRLNCNNIFQNVRFMDEASQQGEVIFSLTNGLNGYAVFDNSALILRAVDADPEVQGANVNGNTNVEVATDVATDRSQRDSVVRAGVSCIGCHDEGLVGVTDELRTFVIDDTNQVEQVDEDFIDAVHPEQDELDSQFAKDNRDFLGAIQELEPPKQAEVEAILALSSLYEGSLDFNMAAAELWQNPEGFTDEIGELDDRFEVLSENNGRLERNAFIEQFAASICELNDGLAGVDVDCLNLN